MLNQLRLEISKNRNPEKAEFMLRYFKKDERVDAKDIFKGISVPISRAIARKYCGLPEAELEQLLQSEIHEERLIGIFILVDQFKKAGTDRKFRLYEFYIRNKFWINQWDLVDSSADRIVGEYLKDKPRDILYKLVKSEHWWERRIAVMATFQFIKDLKESEETFAIISGLLDDKHDLIHKAAGWMLREIGNRISIQKEEEFLKSYYKKMPRTMLRYAIEKFPEELRLKYLKGDV